MKKKVLYLLTISLLVAVLFVGNIGFKQIFSLPEGFLATYDEIESANQKHVFGSFVTAKMNTTEQVSVGEKGEGTIEFKLFGLIPIRKMRVTCSNEEQVYLGGVPIGISLSSKGAIVMSEKMVETEDGLKWTQKDVEFREGDMLTEVNGIKVNSLENLQQIVEESDNGEFEVTYLRANKPHKAIIKGEKDASTQKYKLGLWVRDEVNGVGTLTYARKDNGYFAALGHAITDGENNVEADEGKVFDCQLLGVEKSERNSPGQLRCTFLTSDTPKGQIEKSTQFGVFGTLTDMEGLIDPNLTIKLGGRLSVTPGKAYIVSSVSGIREEYEIEIIKASYQAKADDKSIVFRVKDKRLKELTGGIVQGMSGSPIIQNGKLVGAVTHVFMSDPSKGYGVYSDWMT